MLGVGSVDKNCGTGSAAVYQEWLISFEFAPLGSSISALWSRDVTTPTQRQRQGDAPELEYSLACVSIGLEEICCSCS